MQVVSSGQSPIGLPSHIIANPGAQFFNSLNVTAPAGPVDRQELRQRIQTVFILNFAHPRQNPGRDIAPEHDNRYLHATIGMQVRVPTPLC